MTGKRKLSTAIAVFGIVLLLVSTFELSMLFFGGPLAPLAGFVSLWWLFVAAGIVLYAYDWYGFEIENRSKTAAVRRQDIIEPTNWARENKHELRKSIGFGLIVAGVFAWAFSAVLGLTELRTLWLIVALVGVLLVGISWRLSRGIEADYTREISVRLPDHIALHTFHVRLRQFVEDRGYVITSETSPSEGGREAPVGENVWLSHGSFVARNRPVAEGKTLVPEVQDDPYLSRILTAITLGFVAILAGISLVVVQPGPETSDPNTALYNAAHVIGWLFVLSGTALVVYGYVRRTREWGEIYCVEEGTVYGSDVNLYDERTREDFDSHAMPNVSAPDTACELVVTVGASCTSLYDERRLSRDLEALANSVEEFAEQQRHEFVRDDPGDRQHAATHGSRTVSS